MVFLLLADGFEETEALCTLDLLRRAELEVVSVGINGKKQVTGSHGITVLCDKADNEIFDIDSLNAVILPGGMPGTLNLENDKTVFTYHKQAAFSDVAEGEWYYTAVNACAQSDIVNGMGDGNYAPKNNITRAQAAKLVFNVIGGGDAA